jgi:hypothetical protein
MVFSQYLNYYGVLFMLHTIGGFKLTILYSRTASVLWDLKVQVYSILDNITQVIDLQVPTSNLQNEVTFQLQLNTYK